jgi:hypothetical protein
MKVHKVQIDAEHSIKLLEGKPVAIRVPPGVEVLELKIVPQGKYMSDFAEVIDLVFNGRRKD